MTHDTRLETAEVPTAVSARSELHSTGAFDLAASRHARQRAVRLIVRDAHRSGNLIRRRA